MQEKESSLFICKHCHFTYAKGFKASEAGSKQVRRINKKTARDLLALLKEPEEGRQGANIEGVGSHGHDVVQNPRNLRKESCAMRAGDTIKGKWHMYKRGPT